MSILNIYGPPGCGKTRHAEALRQYYNKTRIVDGGAPDDKYQNGDLVLTQEPLSFLINLSGAPLYMVPFEMAMATMEDRISHIYG